MAQGRVADPLAEVLERDAGRMLNLASPRRVEALNMSIVRDVGGWLPSTGSGQALGQVPLVGELIADAYEDNLLGQHAQAFDDPGGRDLHRGDPLVPGHAGPAGHVPEGALGGLSRRLTEGGRP